MEKGFTLVELLIALLVMSILAGMSWRGVDLLARSAEDTKNKSEQLESISRVIERWTQDMDDTAGSRIMGGVRHQNNLPAMKSEGYLLLLGKSIPSGGWEIVAWASKPNDQSVRTLSRWSSGHLEYRSQRDKAIERAMLWAAGGGKGSGEDFDFMPISSFEVELIGNENLYDLKGLSQDSSTVSGNSADNVPLQSKSDQDLSALGDSPPDFYAPPSSAARMRIGILAGFGGLSGYIEKWWSSPILSGAKK